jgi:hypothetical protein
MSRMELPCSLLDVCYAFDFLYDIRADWVSWDSLAIDTLETMASPSTTEPRRRLFRRMRHS